VVKNKVYGFFEDPSYILL